MSLMYLKIISQDSRTYIIKWLILYQSHIYILSMYTTVRHMGCCCFYFIFYFFHSFSCCKTLELHMFCSWVGINAIIWMMCTIYINIQCDEVFNVWWLLNKFNFAIPCTAWDRQGLDDSREFWTNNMKCFGLHLQPISVWFDE